MLTLLGVNLGHLEALLGHLGPKIRYDRASCACYGPFGALLTEAQNAKKHGVC
jgi:hypothetical protein